MNRSAVIASSSSSSKVRRIDERSTAIPVIRARPIISAVAVAAVRWGLRLALSRARRPVMPLTPSTGTPSTLAVAPANRALTIETPMKVRAAPTPMAVSRGAVPSTLPNIPRASRISPGISTMAPVTRRNVMLRSLRPPSRTASSGDTREARMAGMMADRTVTTSPTRNTTTTVRVWICSGPSGKALPPVLNSCLSSQATPTPPNRPATEAMMPMMTASIRTMSRIWRPLAPIDRSRPSWRVRWPTRMANVL